MVVRPCTPRDAGAVVALRVAGWKTAYRGIIPDSYLDELAVDGGRRRTRMAERDHECAEAVAVQAGEIVGWVVAGPPRDDDRTAPEHGEIYACYVRPGWWRRGVGRLIYGHAVRQLADQGRTSVALWVLEDNQRARRFYESCGMRPDGARKLLDFGRPVAEVRYLLSHRAGPAVPPATRLSH